MQFCYLHSCKRLTRVMKRSWDLVEVVSEFINLLTKNIYISSIYVQLIKLQKSQINYKNFRYKERFQTKYFKPLKQRGVSETLVGRDWNFLERGIDDFRDGLPPDINYNYIKKVRIADLRTVDLWLCFSYFKS